jgi:hypothetical protein
MPADIIINLSESKDAKILDGVNIVHPLQLQKVQDLISKSLGKISRNRNDNIHKNPIEDIEHVHDAITILGTRGSGKSTFLLNLREKLRDSPDLFILKIVDPTVIEEKGHIFLNIVSIIYENVKKKLEKSEGPDKFTEQKTWHDEVVKLSNGLPTLDGIGGGLNSPDWQESEYIMEKGLREVRDARDMPKLFNNFITEALKRLEKKAFLLLLDDVDIDFKKGWPVLETIRKYLTTSKIITIISGDLRLFSLSIRKQYWTNLGKALLINEGENLKKLTHFNDRITEMESQYMLKVIKPERRIYLETLFEKINQNDQQQIFVQDGSDPISIQRLYERELKRFGINNSYQADTYSSFLLSLPLRTQIQLLTELTRPVNSVQQINVTNAFLNDLIEKDVDTNFVYSAPNLLNVQILKLLLKEKILNDVYQLQPITNDNSLNSCLVSLSFLASIKMQSSPYLIFDYWIKIGYVRNLLTFLNYKNNQSIQGTSLTPSIEGLCEYAGVYQNKVLRDITAHITAYMLGIFGDTQKQSAGIIPLPGLGVKGRRGKDAASTRIDGVFKNSSSQQKVIGFIPLSISSHAIKNQSIPTYSLFTLLGTIGELVRKAQLNDLHTGLGELSEVRTYKIPRFESGSIEKEIYAVDELNFEYNDKKDYSNLESDIENWVAEFTQAKIMISPHLLGKIITRLYYALNNIERKEGAVGTNLGDMMHRRIIAFLNALIIEESKENSKDNINDLKGINISNSVSSDKVFVDNLNFLKGKKQSILFSQWMLSCPVLFSYLNITESLSEAFTGFLEKDILSTTDYNVFNILYKVSLSNDKIEVDKTKRKPRNNYELIISKLKAEKVPFSLFELTDRIRTEENNNFIRDNLKRIFKDRTNSLDLRNFRKYLKKTNQRWSD